MEDHDRVRAASEGLVDAFASEPFYLAITADFSDDDGRRRSVLRRYFEYSMGEGERIGLCSVLPDGRGAAVWTKPGPEELLRECKLRKRAFLESILGRTGLANYDAIVGFMSSRTEDIVGGDAWYLSILGVSPGAQRRGLGRKLLEPALAEADLEGAECYLETYSPRSMPFYERLGFRRVASFVEPVTSSEYWIMVRERARRP